MPLLALYGLAVFVLIILSILVAFNFLRYRFKGDKTILFLVIFVLFFIFIVSTTLAMLVRT